MRAIQWHLKQSLEDSTGDPDPKVSPSLLEMVASGSECPSKSAITHTLLIFTDASRDSWGAHLGELMTRGPSSLPEMKFVYKLLGTKGSHFGPKRVPRPLFRKERTDRTSQFQFQAP